MRIGSLYGDAGVAVNHAVEAATIAATPWVFAGSVDKGKADAGETVRVEASDGRLLAWAALSADPPIAGAGWRPRPSSAG